MTKITLEAVPKSFKSKVTFASLEGGNCNIVVEYRYRTREQYFEFVDAQNKEQDYKNSESLLELQKAGMSRDVDYILGVAIGWDVGLPFDFENVKEVLNKNHGAAAAIGEGYRLAMSEGKVKN